MKAAGTNLSATATNYITAISGLALSLTHPNAGTVSTTVTFSDEGTSFSRTAVLSSTRQNAIAFISYLTTGSSHVANGDIIKQEGSKRYLVQNAQGQGQCNLVSTAALAAGQMNIIATDANGSTYFVKKLTARKAVVVQSTQSTAFLVGDGVSTGWTLDAASGTIVSITDTI